MKNNKILFNRIKGLLGLLIVFAIMQSCELLNDKESEDTVSLNTIQGDWIRTQSNNPPNDGMKITVSDANGVLTDPVGSGFSTNDVKWKSISPLDASSYSYSELGSDGNYYDATMTILDDTTINLSVVSSGAGNVQQWIKDNGTYVPAGAGTITLECNDFKEGMTLTNGPEEIDYIVPCVMDITGDVVIEPGVVLAFEANAGLGIYDNGTLKAIGTEAEPIVFRGVDHVKGLWRGIHIESVSNNNVLENVVIEDAGSNYVYCCNEAASLFLKGGLLSLKNVTIRNGKKYGIAARDAAEFTRYENVNVTTHDGYPGYFQSQVVGDIDGMGSDYSGNTMDYFYIIESKISDPTTWKEINIPYLLEGNVFDVTEGLVIESGVELVFEEGGGIGVYNNGFLKIEGIATKPVIVRGKEGIKGYWRGIHIETNSLSNKIDFAQISDAGSNYVYCCNTVATIFLKQGKAAITNSTLSNGKGYGIAANDAFEFNGYMKNEVTTHDDSPLYLAVERVNELDGESSDYTGNSMDYVEIFNSDVDNNITWPKLNVPYFLPIGVVLDIKAGVTFDPGVQVTFSENSGIGIYDNGFFNASGSASKPIVFKGLNNIQGYWRGIHIETKSVNNILNYVQVENAGSNYVYCCNDKAGLFVKGSGQVDVKNSSFINNGGCGIYVSAGANFTESGNSFSANETGDLCE